MEQASSEFEDVEGDVTLADERIIRIVVMPGSALPSQAGSGSPAD